MLEEVLFLNFHAGTEWRQLKIVASEYCNAESALAKFKLMRNWTQRRKRSKKLRFNLIYPNRISLNSKSRLKVKQTVSELEEVNLIEIR